MKIRIVLAGELPAERQIFGEIDSLVKRISDYFCEYNVDAELQMLVSPSYTGKSWMTWNETHQFPMCSYYMRDRLDNDFSCSRTVRKDTPLRDLLGETICDKADALIVVWNEDVTELSGATWELMRIAYGRKAPCIWISTKSHQLYCLGKSYYEIYSDEYISEIGKLSQGGDLQPIVLNDQTGWLMDFWEKCRMKYLKKHKADTLEYPSEEDCLLNWDFKMEEESSAGEGIRKVLLNKFEQFDAAAGEMNSRFQAMLYKRSILPFIATIFLAVGCYTETLLGKTISAFILGMENMLCSVFGWSHTTISGIAAAVVLIAGLLAGIGFLVHACLNLYIYHMSKSKKIVGWQEAFVHDRHVAEILRVLIHITPYGVELDLRKLCGGKQEMYMALKHLADGAEPVEQNVDRKTVLIILQHIKEMLGDQLAYHEASKNRYKEIVCSLEKWGKRLSYFGFWMVVGRGILQFVLSLFPISPVNGFNMDSLVSSFFNMLALLLPAWAGYFSTKVQQNNYRYNLDNHENMLSRLSEMHKRVVDAMAQEEIPMEVFDILIEECAEIMLVEDTIGWDQQYMNLSVKPM